MAAVCLLMGGALAVSLLLSLPFAITLVFYVALTISYSVFLKRKMLIDVVVLAMLYTVRVIAGGVLISVEISEWLLAFSLFVFTALALMKRYTELTVRLTDGLPDPPNRNYRKDDLTVLAALSAAMAANAVTIFALYISSATVVANYSRPKLLWLICPLLLYMLGRELMMAHRREMHDDPIVFALTDRVKPAGGGVDLSARAAGNLATMSDASTARRTRGWAGFLLAAAVGTLLSMARTGHVSGVGNNMFHLPLLAGLAGMPQFAHDPFIQTLPYYASGFWLALVGMAPGDGAFPLLLAMGFASRFWRWWHSWPVRTRWGSAISQGGCSSRC